MIELPGFEVIVPNAVFMNNLDDYHSRELVVLQKYTEITHDQVHDFFMKSLYNVVNNKTNQTPLEKKISTLGPALLQKIIKNPEIVKPYIIGHVDEEPIDQLVISYGTMPLQTFFQNQNISLDSINRYLLSEESREQGFGERWSLELPIFEQTLPPLFELKVLIKYGKSHSDIHHTPWLENEEIPFEAREKMLDTLPPVYHALHQPESLEIIPYTNEKNTIYSLAENSFLLFLSRLEDLRKKSLIDILKHISLN